MTGLVEGEHIYRDQQERRGALANQNKSVPAQDSGPPDVYHLPTEDTMVITRETVVGTGVAAGVSVGVLVAVLRR